MEVMTMNVVSQSPAVSSHFEGWLQLLILSVREVFKTMVDANVAPVYEPSKVLALEWTSMVGFAGDMQGVLMFSCDETSAVRIACKMLDLPQAPNEQAADALGEVCNMIAGNFKHKINSLNGRCALSPPTVVTGTDYRVHRLESKALQSLHVTFTFEGAPIYVSLEVRR
jgi:chemotaxis protein CheX